MDTYVLINLGLLIIFLLGVGVGAFISIRSIDKASFKPMIVYVDDNYVTSNKRNKRKKKVKAKDIEDDDDMFLLSGRITDEVSLTEKNCIANGIDITEVVKENQTDVDNAFEYLANDNDTEFDKEDKEDIEDIDEDLETEIFNSVKNITDELVEEE